MMEAGETVDRTSNNTRILKGMGAHGGDIVVMDLDKCDPSRHKDYYFAPNPILASYSDDELYDYIFEYASNA